ncbi:MAG: hypothetical protein B9S34_09550 [Opitutia bacterium Tous-C1TDCM]|nr:MAG: hypothetical protein B9S34_09550 [Opitutae bacterium Tous-C1TDCM]
MSNLNRLQDVVASRLCLGCGACAYACPSGAVTLHNFPAEGIRPVVDASRCTDCGDCLEVCPAVQADFGRPALGLPPAPEAAAFEDRWGPVLEIWEGHASDSVLRFEGSSGGALTALGIYCIEQAGMHGLLHVAADPANPILNRTVLSRDRAAIRAASGSRYSPASVCDRLGDVERAPAPCAIIGKPAEISAIRNAEKLRPALKAKVGVTMSFFCAESPSTHGTVRLLEKMQVDPRRVTSLRYRGFGWPGHFAPCVGGESKPAAQITYSESWAFLQSFRPWSTHLWPDGTGEVADITCGDPWYEQPDGANPGFSLIVVRTPRGAEIVRGAMAAGYLTLTKAEPWKLEKSQVHLLRKKGSVWGRRLAMSLLGLPVTRFTGLNLWSCWLALPWAEKFRSTIGTIRRILARKLHRKLVLSSPESEPSR